MSRQTLIIIDNDGVERPIPAVFGVCPTCEGQGAHDHPAFRNGITSDEWRSPDWDDDSRAAYVRGDYNVPCTECKGARVVLVPDEATMTREQRTLVAEDQQQRAEWAAEERSERMGFMHD